jgi:hypothetical protein
VRRWSLPAGLTALTIAVWAAPLHMGWWADHVITDVPVYERAWRLMESGAVPYRDFHLEYPPLAAGLFWFAGALPGEYGTAFSVLMCACLVATLLGVLATARALGLDRRRQALAGAVVALSPLILGNLVETRFDLLLAALLSWMLWAAVTDRWRLMWVLFALATLAKLVPLFLLPALIVWQRHRAGGRAAGRGAVLGVGLAVLAFAPFVALSPSGVWYLADYHLQRPLQIESLGSAYLLGLHALADIPVRVVSSFGSQGIDQRGADVIAVASTAAMVIALLAIAATLLVALRRARGPAGARLMIGAIAASTAVLLAGGKVLSPQFLIWLLPSALLVTGRYGWGAFGATVAAMLLTQAYFPARYWDLVALDAGQIAILCLRDAVLVAIVALAWPRPRAAAPETRLLPERATPAGAGAAERAVAARYLTD